jgi:hypothetical protein
MRTFFLIGVFDFIPPFVSVAPPWVKLRCVRIHDDFPAGDLFHIIVPEGKILGKEEAFFDRQAVVVRIYQLSELFTFRLYTAIPFSRRGNLFKNSCLSMSCFS